MAAKYESLTPHPIAVELGLDDSNGPAAILAQAMDALGATGSRDAPNVLYMYLLDAWEKVFASELDQTTLEEHMRWFFGTEARVYPILFVETPNYTTVAGLSSVYPGQGRDGDH